MTTVVKTSDIAPPPCAATEVTVPLCLFDIMWVHSNPTNRLIFYDHPCSEAEFLDAIVPNLNHSLSLALNLYLPVAGNLFYPIDTDKSKPVIRYVSGDSVRLTVAVSARDFDELVASHPRDSDQFYEFLPPMPPLAEDFDHWIVPLFALQATLFPNRGICIGVANHHCLGDARSVAGFMWRWAEINKHAAGGDEFLAGDGVPPPLFDRSVFGDCSEVNEMYWNAKRNIPLKPSSFPLPTNRVRASFTIHRSEIEKLKALVLSKNPNLPRISSFVVTAAYAWSCVAKSAATGGGDELFFCAADARGRRNALVDPPPPANYFGNCTGGGAARLEHEELAADGGFLAAAVAIVNMIETQINDGDNFLKGSKEWLSGMAKSAEMSKLGVTGSPKYDVSEADFGWGKGRRVEFLSLDEGKYLMSVCNSWDSGAGGGGLVVGLSLPRERMEAVAAIFEDGLLKL